MKYFLPLIILFIGFIGFSQNKYITKTGEVSFEASVPSFEEVKALNNSVTAIVNTDNGEFAALVLVKGFRFKNALMEEHFNENYAESDKYPKATFKGGIHNFNLEEISNEAKTVTFSGTLTFHGETKTLDNEVLNISKNNDNNLIFKGSFKTDVQYFNIKIPKIVSNKLSKTVVVTFNFEFK